MFRGPTLKGYHTIHMLCTGVTDKYIYQELFYSFFLGLQLRDKAAMLGINTIELFLEEFT